MKILLFDEDDIGFLLMERTLFPEFEIYPFKTALEAIHWARHHDFDILLVEYARHNVDIIIQLLCNLKEARGDVFRSVISAVHIQGGEATQLLEGGYENIFAKPFSKRQFMDYFEYLG